jgi:hypothetical protein
MLRLVDGVWQRAHINGGGSGSGGNGSGNDSGGGSARHVQYDKVSATDAINGTTSVCAIESEFVIM